jgi:hypothetical protein
VVRIERIITRGADHIGTYNKTPASLRKWCKKCGGHLMTDLPTGAACAALILPTSLLSGALFTMTGAALRRGLPNGARAAGTLTLANTTGAMLGGLMGGFVMLPRLGVERSIFALAVGYGLVALLLFPWGDGPRPARWLRAATAGGAAAPDQASGAHERSSATS